jgi:DNA-binding FadR family transcriptional regulator
VPRAKSTLSPPIVSLTRKKGGNHHLAHLLSDQIEAEICSGVLNPGTKLPTEAALGLRFGASRSPVREALQILKAKGLIVTRQGSGSYLANESSHSLGQSNSQIKDITPEAWAKSWRPALRKAA